MTRVAREAYVLIGGKYPHPQTIVPGGISATIDISDLNEMHLRLVKFFDYGQKVVAIWNDLVDFFYDVNPQRFVPLTMLPFSADKVARSTFHSSAARSINNSRAAAATWRNRRAMSGVVRLPNVPAS